MPPPDIPATSTEDLRERLRAAHLRVADLERELARRGASDPADDAALTRTLLTHLPDYVCFKDRDRRFVRFSDSFEKLLGRPRDEIVGRRDEELFPPEIAAETVADDRRVIEECVPIINKLEGGVVGPGVERWVLTTKLPWRDAAGVVVGLVSLSRDFTEQKKLEDAVRDSERRLRIISDTVPFPLAATRVDDGTVLYANQALAEFLDMPLERLVGSRVPDYYADPREREAIVARVREEGRVDGVEIHLRRHDGAIRTAASFIVPLVIDGHPALMGAGADITELKRREAELRDLGHQKDLLLREVNHRVRNNLATLVALIGQLRGGAEGQARDVLDRLSSSVRGLAAAHAMLSEREWRPVDVVALCREAIHGALGGQERAARLHVHGGSAALESQTAHQLALVMAELVNNTIKHAGSAADAAIEVDVQVEPTPRSLRIRYRDRGPGFPAAVLAGGSRGIGLRLLDGLVTYGLGGRVTLSNDGGAVTTLELDQSTGAA